MILEIVIGVSVLSACVTTITVASLSFVKKLNNDDIALEKEEQARIKAKEDAIQKEKELAEEKERAKLCREDNLKLIDKEYGELRSCPFCEFNHVQGNQMPTGSVCKPYMDRKDIRGLRELVWKNPNPENTKFTLTGVSSGVMVKTSTGYKIWQCCLRCFAEWLVLPASDKPKKNSIIETKKPDVPKHPRPRKGVSPRCLP
jgi:hypothetical protein